MKRLLPALLILFLVCNAMAQKKSELLEQINDLNAQLKTSETSLAESQKNLSAAQSKIDNLDNEVSQLKETNQGLLKNLNSFIEASTQKSDNIGKTLETLRKKEGQLKGIRDVLSSNDSIAFLILTDLKKTLGEDAQIGVENGSVIIALGNTFLFGAKADKTTLEPAAKDFVGKIAGIATKHTTTFITVESTGTENSELIARRAGVISGVMQTDFTVPATRVMASGKISETSGIRVLIHPKFDDFYLWVREQVKN